MSDILERIDEMFGGKNDPIRSCPVYKEIGCSHVDGYLCDMKTCTILKKYKGKGK